MSDADEIIRIKCPKCKMYVEGTFTELFGDTPTLCYLPKMECKQCAVTLEISWPPPSTSKG